MDPSEHPEFFRAIIESSVYVWCVIDRDITITYISPACHQLLGYRPDELTGSSALELVPDEFRSQAVADMAELVAHPGVGVPIVLGLEHADGATVYVEVGAQVRLDDDAVNGIVLRLRPYNDQRLLERYLEALATSVPVEQTLRPLVGSIKAQHLTSEVALAYDWDGSRFRSTVHTGLPDELAGAAERPASVLGDGEAPWVTAIRSDRPVIVPSVDELPSDLRRRARRADLGSCWVYPVPVPPDGALLACLILWLQAAGAPRIGHGPALEHSVWLAALGFERRHSEELLLHAALHDTLTGIPNRSHFFGQLGLLGVREGQGRGRCAVLFADLDGFKEVNDTWGHGVGDEVLAVVANRLQAAVRPGDVVARVGGDEFAVLCTDLDVDADATAVADRLIEVVSEPIAVGSVTATVGLSVGLAFDDPTDDVEDRLVEAADHALYQAKQAGKGRWVVAGRGST